MAKFDVVDIKGYTLQAKPASRWRNLTKDLLAPYWQGSFPSFDIKIWRTEDDAPARIIQIFLLFSNGTHSSGKIQVPALKAKQSFKYRWEHVLLASTGDTFIVVDGILSIWEKGRPDSFKNLYSFNVTPRAWIALAIIAGLLAGIIGAISQILINVFE